MVNIEREIQMTKYSYQRLSTQDKQSFLRQEKYARDHDIPTKNWIQEKASGARKDRPKLQELLSILKEGDELYVIDASRLTRSLSQLLLILDLCKERKLKLIMGDFILDCRGELSVLTQGQIMMLGVLNEMQRLMIVESVNEGLAAAKERNGGVNPGGQPKLTKERLLEKKPEIYELYGLLKSKTISFKSFCGALQVCPNTARNYCKIIEGK